ncbi:hypothetical protein FOZ63_005358, partial [Perkinsus olseni]
MLGCGFSRTNSRRNLGLLAASFLHHSVVEVLENRVSPHTLMLLDGVKYPGNVGNVLANAGKLGCSALLLGDSRGSQLYRRDFALSALCSSHTVRRGGIPLVLNVDCAGTMQRLREEYGYRVVVLENKEVAVQHGLPFIDLSCAASAAKEISSPRVLFVGGGELEGVGPLIPKEADAILSVSFVPAWLKRDVVLSLRMARGVCGSSSQIPTVFDHHHSYNVCSALTLAMFERYRLTKDWPRPSPLPPLPDYELRALREERIRQRMGKHGDVSDDQFESSFLEVIKMHDTGGCLLCSVVLEQFAEAIQFPSGWMLQRQRILRASRLNSVIDFVGTGGMASAKAHTLVMLDGVQYPGNVARVLRYSSSFGAGALILGEAAVT